MAKPHENEGIPLRTLAVLSTDIENEARLTILLLLHAEAQKSFTPTAVAAALVMTPDAAERELALLCGRGFLEVILGTDVAYRYQPATEELSREVTRIAALWSEAPVAVAAVLRARSDDPAGAFADAFRLRTRSGRGDVDDG